jgi:hypothetical protein
MNRMHTDKPRVHSGAGKTCVATWNKGRMGDTLAIRVLPGASNKTFRRSSSRRILRPKTCNHYCPVWPEHERNATHDCSN